MCTRREASGKSALRLHASGPKRYELDKYARVKPFEPVHEISNKVVCATSKASDQPAHARSLIRTFASRLSIL